MGTSPSTSRAGLRADARKSGRAFDRTRSFSSTMRALDDLARSDARVSVCVIDLDRRTDLAVGDGAVTLPVAQLGLVPLLIEVAAAIGEGRVDPSMKISRESVQPPLAWGLWRHLVGSRVRVGDLAVLAAATGDPQASNALLDLVGLEAIGDRVADLGLRRTAVLDRLRDTRGPDDAPHFALSSTRDLASMFGALAQGTAVSTEVSTQVQHWLSLQTDLGLVASATGLDPLDHEQRGGSLMLVNKTGRDHGIRAEAGVLAGPRAGVAYAMIVQFTENTTFDRLRVHDAFRVFGADLMETVH